MCSFAIYICQQILNPVKFWRKFGVNFKNCLKVVIALGIFEAGTTVPVFHICVKHFPKYRVSEDNTCYFLPCLLMLSQTHFTQISGKCVFV